MRKQFTLLAVSALLGGCGFLKRGVEGPAYSEPKSTSIWGTWALRTSADSTTFAGADLVELALNDGSFTLTGHYPAAPPVVVTGTASLAAGGVLTLVPSSSVSESRGAALALHFVAGKPITVLASASGNTLVFAPSHETATPNPSSVWHKVIAAEEAGLVKVSSTARDSVRKP